MYSCVDPQGKRIHKTSLFEISTKKATIETLVTLGPRLQELAAGQESGGHRFCGCCSVADKKVQAELAQTHDTSFFLRTLLGAPGLTTRGRY